MWPRGDSALRAEGRQAAVIDGPWKLISTDDRKSFQLYNLEEDRAEKSDRAADHPQEVARDEDVGERLEECRERRARDGGAGEFRRADLVRPAGDGNGADLREVRFGLLRGAQELPGRRAVVERLGTGNGE